MAGNEDTEREMRNDMQHRSLAGCDLWMLQFMYGASSPTSKEQKKLSSFFLGRRLPGNFHCKWSSRRMMEHGWMDAERENDKMWRKKADRWTKGQKDRWSCERDALEVCVKLCVCVLTGASIPQLCLCWTTLSYSLPLSLFFFHSVCTAFFFLLSLFTSSPSPLERSWRGWKLKIQIFLLILRVSTGDPERMFIGAGLKECILFPTCSHRPRTLVHNSSW